MSQFADLVAAARQLVEETASELPPEGHLFEAILLSQLDAIEGLNSDPAHFILELLQNSDDASFAEAGTSGSDPTLRFTSSPSGVLQLECNEDGIGRENFLGICRPLSTKRESGETTGEKGLGFKTVFRVADIVRIASREYTFRLEKNLRLGPLRPLWDASLDPRPDGGTFMEFVIAPQSREVVNKAVEEFEPANMLFLRKLRRVVITTRDGHETAYVRRVDAVNAETRHVTIFNNGKPEYCYKIWRDRVDGLDYRSKVRPEGDTALELAFPVNEAFEAARPWTASKDVYAYLPVKRCPFAFAVQADFVLSSSREDIHKDNMWNRKLWEAIPEKFVKAVESLNQSALRYTWPRYLDPTNGYDNKGPEDLFSNTKQKITHELQFRRVVETEQSGGGNMRGPGALYRLSDRYRLRGEPMIPSDKARAWYLSRHYPEECYPGLDALGVTPMDDSLFVMHLKAYVNGEDEDMPQEQQFVNQSVEWHARLAEIFLEDTNDESIRVSRKNQLQDVRLVPVETAVGSIEWQTPNGPLLLLLTDTDRPGSLPLGLKIRRIPAEVIQQSDDDGDTTRQQKDLRCEFFKLVGARTPSEPDVIRSVIKLIKEAHSPRKESSLSAFTPEQLVSHALYLYRNMDESQSMIDLYVATESGDPRPASATYFTRQSFAGKELNVPVLNHEYLEATSGEGDDGFKSWLEHKLGIARIPRLVGRRTDMACFDVTAEMRHIIGMCESGEHSAELLNLLREVWPGYRDRMNSLAADWEASLSRKWVRDELAPVRVPCGGRIYHRLDKAILPTQDMDRLAGVSLLPFIDLGALGGYRDDWTFLEELGVKTRVDVHTWLHSLAGMREAVERGGLPPAVDDVSLIYSRIQDACQDKEEVKGLVQYVPSLSCHSSLFGGRTQSLTQ
ncbi:hypothetical protein F5Y17DRAFT_311520 [Xylariaceae sp. FL0594]|nr:hypothetical protein F5Y17DRAFT_311520 [Xylariaceae sp. FL0594]